MLEQLKKRLGITAGTTDNVDMEENSEQVSLEMSSGILEKLKAEFDSFKTEANALAVQYDLEVAELKTQLEAVKDAKSQLEDQLKQMKMAARKTAVENILGSTKADAFLASTELLDDAAFSVCVSAMAGTMAAEANSALFKEVGIEAKANVTTLPQEETKEMQLARAKYAQIKPAE